MSILLQTTARRFLRGTAFSFSLLALLLTMAACGGQNGDADMADTTMTDDLMADTTMMAQGTIVDVVLNDGRFSTLATALDSAGLVVDLQGAGPFTVFAPTDEAFAKLPEGTVEELLMPENRDRLRAILTYHVVQGSVPSADVATMPSATTLSGNDVTIASQNGSVMINDATVTQPDVQASNGVIHVIDTVLMPAEDGAM